MIKTLQNGIRLVTFQNSNAYSATIGVWNRVGSVDEDDKTAGISHVIEHMLFKGTQQRSARDIAFEMDSVGGQLNAFTSKECTCYHATVTYEHLDRAVILLADMIKNAVLDQGELDKERSVILEEINMTEDTPDDMVHEIHGELFFAGTNLASPVIGSKETVSSFNRPDLQRYMEQQYSGNRMVISVAGRFEEDKLVKLLEEQFGDIAAGSDKLIYPKEQIARKDNIAVHHMPVEQVHLCLGYPGVDVLDEDLYNMYIFNSILGGNMSSRLFQTIREQHGLCYSVYSFVTAYQNAGTLTIYSATNPGQVQQLIDLALEEIDKILSEGPSEEEFAMAKEQMKGSYLLGVESTTGRMLSQGRSLLLTGEDRTPEKVMGRIEATDYDIMMRKARALLKREELVASFAGNVDYDTCAKYLK